MSFLQFLDLRNLHYFCDTKGIQSLPANYPNLSIFEENLDEIEGARKFLIFLKSLSNNALYLFEGEAIVAFEATLSLLKKFLRKKADLIISLIQKKEINSQEEEKIREWTKILIKTLVRVGKIHTNFTKMGFKYHILNFSEIFVQNSLLNLCFYTDDSRLLYEILKTYNLLIKEHLTSKQMKLSKESRSLFETVLNFYLKKENKPLNKFLIHFDQNSFSEFFETVNNLIGLSGLTEEKEKLLFDENLIFLQPDNKCLNLKENPSVLEGNILHTSYEYLLKNLNENEKWLSENHCTLFLELKMRKQRKKDLSSIIFIAFNYYQVYSFVKKNSYGGLTDLRDFFVPKEKFVQAGFSLIFLIGSKHVLHDRSILKHFLNNLNSTIVKDGEINEQFKCKNEELFNFLEINFFSKIEEIIQIYKNDYSLLENLINFLFWCKPFVSPFFLNLNLDPFPSLFKNILDTLSDNCIIDAVLKDKKSIKLLPIINNLDKSQSLRLNELIELFLKTLVNKVLRNPDYDLKNNSNSSLLYRNITFSLTHLQMQKLLDPLLKEIDIWKLIEDVSIIQANNKNDGKLRVFLSHSILNNMLLQNVQVPEGQYFQHMLRFFSLENGLVFFRGVFIKYIPILRETAFKNYSETAIMNEKEPVLYQNLVDFVDIYLEDYLLWTKNGCLEYLNLPGFVRPLFYERFYKLIKKNLNSFEAESKVIAKILSKFSVSSKLNALEQCYLIYTSGKHKDLCNAINSLRIHLQFDDDIIFTKGSLSDFYNFMFGLRNPFRMNISKQIIKQEQKASFYEEDNEKISQIVILSEFLKIKLPSMIKTINEYKSKFSSKLPFSKFFNIFFDNDCPDFKRVKEVLFCIKEIPTQDRNDFIEMAISICDFEMVLGWFENSLKIASFKSEMQILQAETSVMNCIDEVFKVFSTTLDMTSNELVLILEGQINSCAKNKENNKKNIGDVVSFWLNIINKKIMRKALKNFRIYKYLSSFMKNAYVCIKKLYKNKKSASYEVFNLYFLLLKQNLTQISFSNKNIICTCFQLSEIMRMSILFDDKKGGLMDNSFLDWLTSFCSILKQKVEEPSAKKFLTAFNPSQLSAEELPEYLAIIFIQYFHLTLLNEFLLNNFLSELLNNRENLILTQEEYSKKANKTFALLLDVADFNRLYSMANEEKTNFFGRLQANYTKYFTKDPQKIGNYSLFGNLLVNYYLSLVFLKKIRVRSQYIFEAIHQRIMACQLGHREKSIYTAFFADLLRQHFQMLYPDWELNSTKKLYNAYQEFSPRISELSLIPPSLHLSESDPIYSITLQALLLNLLARLVQNTNDIELDINKGIDLIFDDIEGKSEYIKYCDKVLCHALKFPINPDDSYAILDETVGKGKEFLIYCAKNIDKMKENTFAIKNNANSSEINENNGSNGLNGVEGFCELLIGYENKLGEIMKLREGLVATDKVFEENKFGLQALIFVIGKLSTMNKPELLEKVLMKIMKFMTNWKNIKFKSLSLAKEFSRNHGMSFFFLFYNLFSLYDNNFNTLNLEIWIKNILIKEKENYSFDKLIEPLKHPLKIYGYLTINCLNQLCEFNSENNTFYLQERIDLSRIQLTRKVAIPDFLKTMIYFLLNTFFDDFFEDLKFEYDMSLLEKSERKSFKEQRLYSSFNKSLIIPILTKLITDFPILIPTILNYRVKEHEAMSLLPISPPENNTFLEYLVWLYPLTNNSFFQLINSMIVNCHVLKFIEKENNNNYENLKQNVCQIALKQLKNLRNIKDFLKIPKFLGFFYGILNLNYLLVKSYKEVDFDYLHSVLNESLNIFLLAEGEDFVKLNEMKVFFALISKSYKLLLKRTMNEQLNIPPSKENFEDLIFYLGTKYSNLNNYKPFDSDIASKKFEIPSSEFQFGENHIDLADLFQQNDFAINYEEFYLLHDSLPIMSTKAQISKILKEEPMEFLRSCLIPMRKEKYNIENNFLVSFMKKNEKLILDQTESLELKLGFKDYKNMFIRMVDKDNKNDIYSNISGIFKKSEEFEQKKSAHENIPSKNDIFLPEIDTPIEISEELQNQGFPPNALSLYGIDFQLFLDIDDSEKISILNAAKDSYEERTLMIQPELIQFLFDFEGNGFPLDALLKYKIDPLYFAELPEELKLAVLDQERKKFNDAVMNIEEQRKLGDITKQKEIKEQFTLQREFEAVCCKRNDALWKTICLELEKMKGSSIQTSIFRRMDKSLINQLPPNLQKIALKTRKEFIDCSPHELEEENKENNMNNIKESDPKEVNHLGEEEIIDEMEKLLLSIEDSAKSVKPLGRDRIRQREAFLEKAEKIDLVKKIVKIPSEVADKIFECFLRISSSKVPTFNQFFKAVISLTLDPTLAPCIFDGFLFILNSLKYNSKFEEAFFKNIPNDSPFQPLIKSLFLQKEEENEKTKLIKLMIETNTFRFFKIALDKSLHIPLLFDSEFSFTEGLIYKSQKYELGLLKKVRDSYTKAQIQYKKEKFILSFFTLFEENENLMEHLKDLLLSLETKIQIFDYHRKEHHLHQVEIDKKELITWMLSWKSKHFYDISLLNSFLTLLINDKKDCLQFLDLLLQNFIKEYQESLQSLPKQLETFRIAENLKSSILDPINNENASKLFSDLDTNILSKFKELKNLSRTLKHLSGRIQVMFKQQICKKYLGEYSNVRKIMDKENLRFWLQDNEKLEFNHVLPELKEVVEKKDVGDFFKDIITGQKILIDVIGEDFNEEEYMDVFYGYLVPGIKAFIYLYSLLNPIDELTYDSINDVSEAPQLSKLLSFEESKGIGKNKLILDDILTLLDERFCGLFDLWIKKCSNNHDNNKLSFVWRYIIQTNASLAKISGDTKFILIKNIAREKAKNVLNCGNRNNVQHTKIKRTSIWNSTLEKLLTIKPAELTLDDFKIEFDNEEGVDAGGLKREWLSLLSKEIFDPEFGLFKLSANSISYQPSSLSYIIPDHLIHFRMIGRIIAKCLVENWNLGVYFPKSFLKHILRRDLNLKDLEDIDGDLAKGLQWTLNNAVEGLDATFTYEREEFGERKIYELIPGGSNISVTENNKREFIKLLASTKMGLEIQEQTQAMILGIHEVIPVKAISLLDEKELGLKIAGMPEINVEEMRATFVLVSPFNNDTIDWLFDILEEYEDKMRAQFWFFTSGSFRVPSEGFKRLPLKIQKYGSKNALPVAHTCFNQLDLPEYDSKEILKEKLELAILEGGEGFYIV